MMRRQTYVWSIFTGASAAYRWFPPRRECFRFAGAEANSAGGGAGASSGVHQTVAVNAAPEGFWRCLFSSWQQGLVASIGAVTGIGAVGFFLYVSMKDDTVHHTAAVASEALGDARLRERATNLSKEVVESVLKDQKSVELVVGLVVRVLQEDDSMIAVSSFLRSLFEDHYTQEVTKKFVLMTLLDPWIQEQVRLIAKDLVKGLLRDPEVKKALVEFLSDSAATSLHDERLHYNMAHAVRSVAKRAVSPFTFLSVRMFGAPNTLLADLHLRFLTKLDDHKDKMKYWTSQHLKMNGVFWCLGAMKLLGHDDILKREELVDFVVKCWNSDGGFGGNIGQDSHMLYTLSAVQLLCLLHATDAIDAEKCARWVASMQLPDGSFQGDEWGEVDTRFVYVAMNCLQLLGKLELINVKAAVEWMLRCQNWDGGFGLAPGAESHAGQIFCCVGSLRIAGALDRIDKEQLAGWLAMRQLPSGGLNGRPEKKADVCYSWWVVSSLSMLGYTEWIDRHALFRFVLACQDSEDGGIADKPGNQADVYHTFYGLCGLSLLGYEDYPLRDINPVYAMPYDVLESLGVPESAGLHVGRKRTCA